MSRSTQVAWQVLHDEDEWSREDTQAPVAFDTESAAPQLRRHRWRWLSLGVACGLLLLQLGWALLPGAANSSFAGRAGEGVVAIGVEPTPRLYAWESAYFIVTYRQGERSAVADAARLLDARHGQLRRALGLPTQVEGQRKLLGVEGIGLEESEAFVCAGLAGLVDEAIDQALPTLESTGSWQVSPSFELGLRGWAHLQVCPADATVQKGLFVQTFSRSMPCLAELHPALYNFPYRGQLPQQTERDGLAFVAFFDYAVAEYGAGRLPLLLAALGQPVTWDELIPGVFDRSVDEFEAGWRAWLTEEYGL